MFLKILSQPDWLFGFISTCPLHISYHASQARWTTSCSPTHPVVSNPHRFFTAWKDYFSPPSPLLTHLWGVTTTAASFLKCCPIPAVLPCRVSLRSEILFLCSFFLSLPRMTQMLTQNCEDRCCDFFLFILTSAISRVSYTLYLISVCWPELHWIRVGLV